MFIQRNRLIPLSIQVVVGEGGGGMDVVRPPPMHHGSVKSPEEVKLLFTLSSLQLGFFLSQIRLVQFPNFIIVEDTKYIYREGNISKLKLEIVSIIRSDPDQFVARSCSMGFLIIGARCGFSAEQIPNHISFFLKGRIRIQLISTRIHNHG